MQIRVHINENKNATPDWDHHFVRPGRVRSCVLNYLLSNLSSNIQLLHADFTRDFLSSSSFWPLRKELEKSSWSTVHLSDAIRLILLQRYGGYYLDFDNIVLRPLHCLNNTLSYLEEAPNIENGIMILDAGHPFLQFLMDFSAKHYERNNRVSLGPPRVGQAFLQFCNTSQLAASTYQCQHSSRINLIHPDAFFPIKHYNNRLFYSADFKDLDTKVMERANLTHVYLSSWGTRVHANSLYARLAREYCPLVWAASSNLAAGF